MDINPHWEYVADQVMGGVSEGRLREEMFRGRMASVLRGDVSLANNGGFIQMAFDLRSNGAVFDASSWDGLELDVCGNGELYDIRLRTDQLTRPWQSFRTEIPTVHDWHTLRIGFDTFTSHRTDAIFDPVQLRRIGVLAIGREFHALIAIAGLRFYRKG